jgi:hypothetical protein
MTRPRVLPGILLVLWLKTWPIAAGEPPHIEHQPSPCTVPDKAISLCATITDDGQVAGARIYFKPAREKAYSFVEMAFGGINFCGTLPAPRRGKIKRIDYYIHATDDQFQSQRTSTFQMDVGADGSCEFPPVENDTSRSTSIKVYATEKKQGNKLAAGFEVKGVSFIPLPGRGH